jgi:hypothetical protein
MTNRHPSDRSDGVAYRTTEAARRTTSGTEPTPPTVSEVTVR